MRTVVTPELNGHPNFLNKNIETIFVNFLKNEYKLDFFSNPNERKGGLFPPLISDLDVHNNDFNLNHFTQNISLHKNHLIFISIQIFIGLIRIGVIQKKVKE